MQNSFEELKRAWEIRKGELEARLRALGGAGLFSGGGYGGGMYGGAAQQYAQLENVSDEKRNGAIRAGTDGALQQMAKEAGLHVGTSEAAACSHSFVD